MHLRFEWWKSHCRTVPPPRVSEFIYLKLSLYGIHGSNFGAVLHNSNQCKKKIKASSVNFGLCSSVEDEQKKQLEGVSDISQVLFVTLNCCLCIWGKLLWEHCELRWLQVKRGKDL